MIAVWVVLMPKILFYADLAPATNFCVIWLVICLTDCSLLGKAIVVEFSAFYLWSYPQRKLFLFQQLSYLPELRY